MLRGKIFEILTQKDDDWGRYKIDTLDGKEVLAVGIIPQASLGMTVVLEGKHETNSYGKQFAISSVLDTKMDEFAGIRRYLSCGFIKGVKKKTADSIIKTFGTDTLKMFELNNGIRLSEVKGISEKKIPELIQCYNETKQYAEIMLLLNGSATKQQVIKIYEKYGDKTIAELKKNPYKLQELQGFGFLKTDTIALASGVKPDSVFRIAAAIRYILDNASATAGHCYLPMDTVKSDIIDLLVPLPKFEALSVKIVSNAMKDWDNNREKLIKKYDPEYEILSKLDEVHETRRLILQGLAKALSIAIEEKQIVNDDGRIYSMPMYQCETNCAKKIKSMLAEKSSRFISKDVIEKTIAEVEARKTKGLQDKGINTNFCITDEQRQAVYLGAMHKIAIISGGPGRGKTAITEIIAKSYINAGRFHTPEDILMLAPTGRAAQRITESTGYAAMTAQRAVLCSDDNRPHGKLIICDESSMVDIWLLYKVLHFSEFCNLIFVGDVSQIASVGPGKVLADLISSNVVPYILLKKGHRNSGAIAHNAELINSGMKLDKYIYDEHFRYYPANKDSIQDMMINEYVKKIQQYGIKEVMMCTAMHRGVLSVDTLNLRLQELLTKGEEAVFGNKKFRVGDRVMQTKNDYKFQVKLPNGTIDTGIFNGERGTVAKIAKLGVNDDGVIQYGVIVLFDDGKLGAYSSASINNLSLAYVTTLHKCQGSEAKCMIMGYVHGDYLLLNKQLFYTGETRAKEEFVFFGEEKYMYGRYVSAFDIAVSKNDDALRNTYLAERIAA